MLRSTALVLELYAHPDESLMRQRMWEASEAEARAEAEIIPLPLRRIAAD